MFFLSAETLVVTRAGAVPAVGGRSSEGSPSLGVIFGTRYVYSRVGICTRVCVFGVLLEPVTPPPPPQTCGSCLCRPTLMASVFNEGSMLGGGMIVHR